MSGPSFFWPNQYMIPLIYFIYRNCPPLLINGIKLFEAIQICTKKVIGRDFEKEDQII